MLTNPIEVDLSPTFSLVKVTAGFLKKNLCTAILVRNHLVVQLITNAFYLNILVTCCELDGNLQVLWPVFILIQRPCVPYVSII